MDIMPATDARVVVGAQPGRRGVVTRNDVQGIGFALKNDDATYGSAGRLKGITLFPMPIYFDGASTDFVHELGKLQDTVPPFPSEVAVATIEESLGRLVESVALGFGATARLKYMRSYPATINSEREASFAAGPVR